MGYNENEERLTRAGRRLPTKGGTLRSPFHPEDLSIIPDSGQPPVSERAIARLDGNRDPHEEFAEWEAAILAGNKDAALQAAELAARENALATAIRESALRGDHDRPVDGLTRALIRPDIDTVV